MINGMLSSVGPVRIDSTTESLSIGPDAGTGFDSDDDYNIAIGTEALQTAGTDKNKNIGVGAYAMKNLTTGDNNIAIGYQALLDQTTGGYNIAIGSEANSNGIGNAHNVIVGYKALKTQAENASNGSVVIGASAAEFMNTTGSAGAAPQTIIGYYAARYLGDTDNNVNKNNTIIGYKTLGGGYSTDTTENVAYNNTALGHQTLGAGAADGSITALVGYNNIAIGHKALYESYSSTNCTVIGASAGDAVTTADDLVLIGAAAGGALTTGSDNTVIGKSALSATTTGVANVAIGSSAMAAAVDDDQCVAIGAYALSSMGGINGAAKNVAVGYESGFNLDTGIENTFLGHQAGRGTNVSNVATGNVAVGYRAGYVLATNGNYNSAVGHSAGDAITSGDNNVCIGYLSDGAPTVNSQVAIGKSAISDRGYHTTIGHYGGKRWATRRFTLSATGYQGTPADGDAAHSGSMMTLPPYSYIKRVYVTVITLSQGTADFQISYSATTDTSGGVALTSPTEILGADASATHWLVRSQTTQDGASNIAASSDDTAKVTWVSINKDADDSQGWIGSSQVGIYLTHSGANSSSDPGTDAEVHITIEYEGTSI